MAVVNVELAIYKKIWELLEADTEWAALVPVGNRIRFDDLQGDEDPDKSNVADGDRASVRMTTKSGNVSFFTIDPTFETHSPSGPTDWMERHEFVFRLTTISQLLSVNESSALSAQTRQAIRAGGPRLGLPFVVDFKITFEQLDRRQRSDRFDEDLSKREVVDHDLTVTCELAGESLGG